MNLLAALYILSTFVVCQEKICEILPATTICGPEFEGFPINKTVADFNDNLKKLVANSTYLAGSLIESKVCTKDVVEEILTLRYQVSFQCAYFIDLAIKDGCTVSEGNPQQKGPLLCPDICYLASSTVSDLANNAIVCPTGKDNIDVKAYTDYCSALPALITENNGRCNNGSMTEDQFCGFPDTKAAEMQCPKLNSDPCCMRFLSLSKDKPSASSASESGLSRGVIIILVVSILLFFFLIACAAGIFYLLKKRRGSNVDRKNTFSFFKGSINSNAENGLPTMKEQSGSPTDFQSSQPASRATAPSNLKMFTPLHSKYQKGDDRLSTASLASRLLKEPFRKDRAAKSNDSELLISLQDMPEGTKKVDILHPYESTMEDELTLIPGSFVYMVRAFDDGWALGVDPYKGQQGAFPLVCVNADGDDTDGASRRDSHLSKSERGSISNRDSSLLLKDLKKRNSKTGL